MKAIAVDDELYMLENLEEAIRVSSDIEQVECFSTCSAALTYAEENSSQRAGERSPAAGSAKITPSEPAAF